jgi:acyl-CoA thioester hydrolase
MSDRPTPELPTAIISEQIPTATTEQWFEYPVRAHPHHTDYGGVVWHGSYLSWMEEARVECLRSLGMDFAELVGLGYDLPVVDLSLRYHRALRMGEEAVVRTRMEPIEGVRIHWEYRIESPDGEELYVSGRVTLVGIDREKGKIVRQLPPAIKEVLRRFFAEK